MFDPTRDPRSEAVYQRLTAGHTPVVSAEEAPRDDEVPLKVLPRISLDSRDEMVERAREDLAACLRRSFGLADDDATALPLTLRTEPTQQLNKRSHTIMVEPDGITVVGASPWGLAAALYHMQRIMLLRGAPVLPRGMHRHQPRLDPSLAYPAFKRDGMTELDYPEAYHDNYLASVARAGYTGFHLNLSMDLFTQSARYPELNHPQAEENFDTLNRIIARARRHALEVYLSYYSAALPGDHPLFARLPAMRGARIMTTDSLHPLCIASTDTMDYYREHFHTLFERAPGLAGVLPIVGCEGLLHCYTAPVLDENQQTVCPACAARDPEQSVAEAMGEIARAIHSADPHARCIVWTYGIHAWSENHGRRFVEALPGECELMTNFDTGDNFTLHGATGHCFDYSLRCVGPSAMFKQHQTICARRGIRLHAKCESAHPMEFYNLPTVPANTRWGRKYEGIVRSAAAGALFNWKFLGFTGQRSEELAGWMSWRGYDDADALLRQMARRDFGAECVESVMAAWRRFDEAMEHHPFSQATAGYFKGPFYIAFAHPLILDPTRIEGLDGEFHFGGNDEHALGPRRRTRYVTDLSWVQPFGVEGVTKALADMTRLWSEGLALLPEGDRLTEHRALCEGILCMLRTAANMVRFCRVRDEMFREPATMESFRDRLLTLQSIARDELHNAEAGLRCMDDCPMLGFQYTYRATFTRSMVEQKIAHTRRQAEHDIPHRYYARCITQGHCGRWLTDRSPDPNGDRPT